MEGTKKGKHIKEILFRHFYILNIAFIQEIFKMFISELVDRNHEYARRLTQKHTIKFEIDHISNVLSKKFTLGEFLASQFQPNSLEELAIIYSSILGENFYPEFKSRFKGTMIAAENISEDEAIAFLAKMFEKRHIVAHEVNKIESLNPDEYLQALAVVITLYFFLKEKSGYKSKLKAKIANPTDAAHSITIPAP
jgi:hypothetical protein